MTNKNQKMTVTKTVSEVSPYQFEMTLSNVRSYVDELIRDYGDDARLDWDRYRYFDYDTTPSPVFWVKKDQLETDQELEARLVLQSEYQQALEEKERAEFERLKSKFDTK